MSTIAMRMAFLILFPFLLLIGRAASGGLDPDYKLVPLKNGINAIDLNRDGKEDAVVVAHRENFNAHSYEVTSIYIWASQDKGAEAKLQVVPIEPTAEERKANQRERLNVQTSGGADCVLHDFRLFTKESDKSVILITADRLPGKNLTDSQRVTFRFYKLATNTDEIPGGALLFFKQFDTAVSKASFCDVNRAFNKELGVPTDGRSEEGPE